MRAEDDLDAPVNPHRDAYPTPAGEDQQEADVWAYQEDGYYNSDMSDLGPYPVVIADMGLPDALAVCRGSLLPRPGREMCRIVDNTPDHDLKGKGHRMMCRFNFDD